MTWVEVPSEKPRALRDKLLVAWVAYWSEVNRNQGERQSAKSAFGSSTSCFVMQAKMLQKSLLSAFANLPLWV